MYPELSLIDGVHLLSQKWSQSLSSKQKQKYQERANEDDKRHKEEVERYANIKKERDSLLGKRIKQEQNRETSLKMK